MYSTAYRYSCKTKYINLCMTNEPKKEKPQVQISILKDKPYIPNDVL